MIKKIKISLCIWGTAFHMGISGEFPLDQIQELYASFSPNNAELSPVQGMIALRTGILQNIRFHGYYGPKNDNFICHYQITKPRHGHESQEKTNCPQDNTTAVIQQLFPSASGEFSVPGLKSDFFVANKARLGKILISVYEARQKKLPYEDAYKLLRDAFGKLSIKATDAKVLKEEWGIDDLNILLDKYAKIFAGSLTEQDRYPKGIIETALLAFMEKLTDKRSNFSALMSDLESKLYVPQNMAQREAQKWQSSQSAILSQTPKKYPESNGDQKAFDALITKYKNAIKEAKNSNALENAQKMLGQLDSQGYLVWKKEQYDKWKRKNVELRDDFSKEGYFAWKQRFLKPNPHGKNTDLVPDLKILEELLEKDPERFIFNTLIYDDVEVLYPVMMGTGRFHFYYKKNGQIIHYENPVPDCGETTLRNLFNLALADPKSKTFNTSYLREKFPKALPLFNFYDEKDVGQKTYDDVSKDDMRSRWAQVVSNLNKEGENFIKYADADGRCNIQSGVDNMLAVVERVLGDETFAKIRAENIPLDQRRKRLLDHLFQSLSHDGFILNWSVQRQDGKKIEGTLPENIGNLIVTVNNNEASYLWEFRNGHFEFNPLYEQNAMDWRKERTIKKYVYDKFKHSDPFISPLKGTLSYYIDARYISSYGAEDFYLTISPDIFYSFPLSQSFEKKLDALDWGLRYSPKVVENLAPHWLESIATLNDPGLNNKTSLLLLSHREYFKKDAHSEILKMHKKTLQGLIETQNESEYEELENFLSGSLLKKERFLPDSNIIDYIKANINYIFDEIKNTSNKNLRSTLLKLIDKKELLEDSLIAWDLFGFITEVSQKGNKDLTENLARLLDQNTDLIAVPHRTASLGDCINEAAKTGNVGLMGTLLKILSNGVVKMIDKSIEMRTTHPSNRENEISSYENIKLFFSKDDFGNTPLHLAVQSGNTDLVRVLLKNENARQYISNKGNILNGKGLSPIDMVFYDENGNPTKSYNPQLVKLLLDDPEANQLTKTSKPLLDVILTTRDEAMLELFLSKKYLKYFNKLYDDFKKENQASDKLQQMDEFIRKAEDRLGIKGRIYGSRGLPKLGKSGFRRTPYT